VSISIGYTYFKEKITQKRTTANSKSISVSSVLKECKTFIAHTMFYGVVTFWLEI
jgi:hypothetical protein